MIKEPLSDIIFSACSNPAKLLEPQFASPTDLRKIGNDLKDLVRTARRYYIDEDVTRAATRLGVQHPDILQQMLARARTPFKRIWVEWPVRPQLEEAGAPIAEPCAERAGCFIERVGEDSSVFRMTCVAQISDGNGREIAIDPISTIYDINSPYQNRVGELSVQTKITGFSSKYFDRTLLGSAYVLPEKTDDTEMTEYRAAICDRLAQHASYITTPILRSTYDPILNETGPYRAYKDILRLAYRHAIVESAGTWRFIIVLLAMINQHDYVESDQPWRVGKTRSVSGKFIPYIEHLLVKLKLPRGIVEHKMISDMAAAIPRRRHEVQGHYAQFRKKGLLNCDHIYVDETATRQVCAIVGCGHKRWWRNEFMRGSAEIGFVTKDRLVTRK